VPARSAARLVHRRAGDKHQLFLECRYGREFGMVDRTGDKGAIERAVEHGGDQIRGGRGSQAQSYRRKRR